MRAVPTLLDDIGVSATMGNAIFGFGLMFAVIKGPEGLAGLFDGLIDRFTVNRRGRPLIRIDKITVQFGGVRPLDELRAELTRRHRRPDRPERRRQDHFAQRHLWLRAPVSGSLTIAASLSIDRCRRSSEPVSASGEASSRSWSPTILLRPRTSGPSPTTSVATDRRSATSIAPSIRRPAS